MFKILNKRIFLRKVQTHFSAVKINFYFLMPLHVSYQILTLHYNSVIQYPFSEQ